MRVQCCGVIINVVYSNFVEKNLFSCRASPVVVSPCSILFITNEVGALIYSSQSIVPKRKVFFSKTSTTHFSYSSDERFCTAYFRMACLGINELIT